MDLFNSLARVPSLELSVFYSQRYAPERSWKPSPIFHDHVYLTDVGRSDATRAILQADFVVFGGYRPAGFTEYIRLRNRSGGAWAFWGERPGFRLRGWLGRQFRAWALREVRSSKVPIWGIGDWAVEGYRSEFGDQHMYFNVPYYSNLIPFFNIQRSVNERCRFLYSGSLIHRKGVDLLLSAFGRLLSEGIRAELSLVGAGPLDKLVREKLGHSDQIRLHGFKQWDELASVYAQSDILCAPSRYDGWGLIVPEGLAAGMPVIATNRTGSALELIDSRNGWLIKADDEVALYQAMRSAVFQTERERRLMSRYARESSQRMDAAEGATKFRSVVEMSLRHFKR